MPIGAILGGIGAGINLLSPLFSKNKQPDQINPYTDQRLKDLMATLGLYEPQVNRLGGEAEAARFQQNRAASEARGLSRDMEDLKGPQANEWFDQFLQNIPEYQAVASEVSRMATEKYGRDITAQGRVRQEQAIRAAQEATAGQGFSGAAAQAVGSAAAQTSAEADLQAQSMAADIFNQSFNNLAGQGQQLTYQDTQMQFQNALQALQAALQGQQVTGGLFGQVGQQALGQQGNILSYLQSLQANIQDITQPVYSQGQTVNPLGNVGNALGAMGGFIDAAQAYPWGGAATPTVKYSPYDAAISGGN